MSKEFYEDFVKMLAPLNAFGNHGALDVEDGGDRIRVALHTYKCRYSLTAAPADADSKGYLGGIAHVRVGGGNDLSDGDFSQDTFNKILADIVSYEIAMGTSVANKDEAARLDAEGRG